MRETVEWFIGHRGLRFPILPGRPFLIGKQTDCDLPLDFLEVSRRHGEFQVDAGMLTYRDLGSTNGTRLDGRCLARHETVPLESGQELEVGERVLIRVESQPVSTSEPSALNPEQGIEALLAEEGVNEILVNGPEEVWVERRGALERVPIFFSDEGALLHLIRRYVSAVGRKIDHHMPFVDARLPNGFRICAVIQPAVLGGAHLCIRRFPFFWPSLDSLQQTDTMSPEAHQFLKKAVERRANILVCGSTGSGKTTLLNALGGCVPDGERILTLEDTAELRISHPHVVRLESRPANIEGEGEISLRMLLRTALRMRPDRILVGECRGPEALDLLQALNTGHAGSMASIHASSCRDALARLEILCLLNGENNLPLQALRQYIASAIQVIVFMERKNGQRRVAQIQEVTGLEEGIFLLRNVSVDSESSIRSAR